MVQTTFVVRAIFLFKPWNGVVDIEYSIYNWSTVIRNRRRLIIVDLTFQCMWQFETISGAHEPESNTKEITLF